MLRINSEENAMRCLCLAIAVALFACGSSGKTGSSGASGADGGGSGASGGGTSGVSATGGSGGTTSGGTGGAPTAGNGGEAGVDTGGFSGEGTSGTGGSGGSGSSGGSGTGGTGGTDGRAACRNTADCGTSTSGGFFECVPPGTTPQQDGGCGAPDWCMQCSCPPRPIEPYGIYQDCVVNADCPTATTVPGLDRYASFCGAGGTCVACRDDGDCPSDAPRCAINALGQADCFECVDGADCADPAPVCDVVGASLGGTGGSCVPCSVTSDCATGICLQNACVDQCSTDAECGGAPEISCVDARCVPRPCTSSGDCPALFACTQGACHRITCQSDAVCGGGTCVNAACYDGLGSCYEIFAMP